MTSLEQITKNLSECKPPCSLVRVRMDGDRDMTVIMAIEGELEGLDSPVALYQVWNFCNTIVNPFKLYAGKAHIDYATACSEYDNRIREYERLQKQFALQRN